MICVICQKVIEIGERYGFLDGGFVVHLACLIAESKRKKEEEGQHDTYKQDPSARQTTRTGPQFQQTTYKLTANNLNRLSSDCDHTGCRRICKLSP